MYLGSALLFFGGGFSARSPSFLILGFIYLAAIHAYLVWIEEPNTARRFGRQYDLYMRRVPRWLPLLGPVDKDRNIPSSS
jgi:protein-S-isoprenylcysteine O-methyltransferase Ste14